ncbi:polyketide synthase [Fusarium sporotrichioides]|uniref:Polyketide synthase n=1 Tax=Fusarium sporotrichioides TaxID=5514 RepID=A0A395SNE3_FUSSP|nr:polyketide synthase [Fusarium sporotrichioides]
MSSQSFPKEPIAIIGTSCRFPGGANTPSKLWDLLTEKRDVQSPIPLERFNVDAFYSSNGDKNGCTDVKKAYLLSEDIRLFDASFFKINPREAEAMDPQQRLLLEAVYEATETAGLPMEDLKGSDTAVYVGCMTGDYHEMLMRDPQDMPKYMATGTARSILSNRISYLFDWKGPSMTIDTACSSSLVAVYDAVTALRNGVSRIACAGGVNLILGPEMMISESKLHMLSPTGRSKMWDASANGYARGEGVAALMMKTLSQALADGDHIEGIIREIGVNSDGRTNGITLPSPDAQKALIRQTYRNAGLDVFKDRCQFFEAHGTGTPAGDPLEARAIHEAFFGNGDIVNEPMYVGSVKTAIGHLEGCAGLAGMIKALEAVKRGIIPPNQLFENLNPAVKPYTSNLKLPVESQPWPETAVGSSRRASVNSFGFGGTNVHAIIENFDNTSSQTPANDVMSMPLVLSANSDLSLRAQISQLADVLQNMESQQVESILYTLAHRRSQLPLRTFFSGSDLQSLQEKLNGAMAEDAVLQTAKQDVPLSPTPRILGVFTGQGAQWPTMGRELLKSSPFARRLMASLEESLASLPQPPAWTLTEQIMADKDASRLSEAAISQPLCTAVQLMLVELLRKAGINFDCVIGHSSGEISAAYAAGFLSLHDAIRVAYFRGVCAKLAGGANGAPGSMMAVGLSYEEASVFCEENFPGLVDVAASNAPASTTLSGDKSSIEEAKVLLDQQGTFARVLRVDTAYHSHHMHPCAEPYLDLLQAAKVKALPGNESCEWYSSVLGERIDASLHGEALAGEYWVENMINPVLFSMASELVADDALPCHVALEVGPHPALKGPFNQTYKRATGSQLPYQATLSRNIHDVAALSDTLGFIWSHLGKSSVDFTSYAQAFSASTNTTITAGLPPYPWDHTQSFWRESRKSLKYRQRAHAPHPLLGVRSVEDPDDSLRWLNHLRLEDVPWLDGHKVEGQVVLPAAAYLVMAVESARAIDETKEVQLVELSEVHIMSAIQLGQDSQAIETVFTLDVGDHQPSHATATWSFSTPLRDGNWKCNAKGQLRIDFGSIHGDSLLPTRVQPVASLTSVDVERFYSSLTSIGLEYTGEFKHLDSIERQLSFASARARQIAPDFAAMIHPALLDAAFQSIFAAYCWPDDGSLQAPFVPTYFRSLRILNTSQLRHGDELVIDSFLTNTNERELTADMDVFEASNDQPVLQLEGLTCTSLLRPGPSNAKELYTKTEWEVDISSAIASAETEEVDTESDLELVDLCERLSYFYLRELNNAVGRDEVPNFDWNYQRIFEWIDQLFPSIQSGNHPTIKKEWSSDSRDWLMQQSSKFPGRIDLQLIQAVGENLPAVVRKQTTMLEHMVKDDMLNRIYKYGLGFERANVYLGRISKQLAHRYPRMNILEIGAGTGGATKGILESLGTTFESYTFTDISTGFFEAAAETFEHWAAKMIFKPLNIENEPTEQGFPQGHYDFIIASNVLHATKSLEVTMKNTRKLLKPGGQLLLLEVTSDIVRVKLMMSGLSGWWLGGDDGRRYGPTIPVSQWDSLLKQTGFSGVDKTVNDFVDDKKYMTSVMLSQAVDDKVQLLRQPLATSGDWLSSHSFTIVGGKYRDMSSQMVKLLTQISGVPENLIHCVENFEQLASSDVHVRSALVLEDLDEPILKNLTNDKLRGVQRLINESRQVLWVSKGCQRDDPFANMSVGMCRSLASEYPHINLQHVDVEGDVSEVTSSRLVEAFLQLVYRGSLKSDDIVWSIEAEMILRDDQWFISRVKSDQALNDQLNASNMTLHTKKALASDTIEIQQRRNQFVLVEPVHSLPVSSSSSPVDIIVTHSLLYPFKLGQKSSGYLCYGYTDNEARTPVLAVSGSSRSRISVPPFFVWDLSANDGEPVSLLHKTAFTIAAERVLGDIESGSTILIHESDGFIGAALRWKAADLGLEVVLTTSDFSKAKSGNVTFVHALAPERVMKKVVPQGTKLIVDLSGKDYEIIGSPFQKFISPCVRVLQLQDILDSQPQGIEDPIIHGVRDAIRSSFSIDEVAPVTAITDLANKPVSIKDYAAVVNFSIDATIPAVIQPLEGDRLFRSDKTYLLIGFTGGLGKALCRWMVSCGVRHIALTTRNVDVIDKVWLEELQMQGAQVNLFQADVSERDVLTNVYQQIVEQMPPICGAANAALLLSDRTFSELKVQDFSKVFGPKVKATQNLHDLLKDQKLDFFIMFSSLASVVGNRGQVNYAASNLFMSAIAEQRRAQGLAASVMHIGMVLGVGYVSSTGAYEATLRSSNYMAISETDLRNMFSQAILVGRPDSTRGPELITGLNRYSLEPDAQKYFWRDNMRFSHHTLEEERQERSSSTKVSMSQRLEEAKDATEILSIVEEEFCTKLERMLQAEAGSIKTSQSLLGLGVDSLIAAEIRSWFFKELDIDTPVLEILNTASISELCSTAVSNLPSVSGQPIESKTEVTKEAIKFLDTAHTSTAVSSALPTDHEPFTRPNSTQVTTSEADSEDKATFKTAIIRSGPLSFAQERLWFLQQFLQDTTTYNVTMNYRISGSLRLNDLGEAFQQVIQRHETLRTAFFIDTETDLPKQAVLKHSPFSLDVKHNTTAKLEYERMQKTTYDLEKGDVVRAVIVPNSDDEYDLIFGFHHIALDGFSAQIMVRDLAMAYSGQTLAPKELGYLDFAIAQKAAKIPTDIIDYWKAEFKDLPSTLPVFDFAETKMRIPLTDYTTRAYERTLPAEAGAKTKAAARDLGVTPFHIHLAALQVVLSDLASTNDICIGITDANKNDAAFMDAVGFFVNLLPLRLQSRASQTLAGLACDAKTKANHALARSQIPFDVFLDELKLPRSTMHSPLFQVVLNFKMGSTQKVPLADCQAQLVTFKDANNPYDLAFDIETYNDGSTSIVVKTQEYLYTKSELSFILDRYTDVLSLFASESSQTLGQACKPSTAQIQKALSLGKGERIPSPHFETLCHYFDDWVEKQPDATALKTDDGKTLAWRQLKELVNQIAATLIAGGVTQGSKVGVYCEPSMYIFALLIAISKIGGVYVPLDAQNPVKRLQLIVDDCQPDVVVIDDSTKDSALELSTAAKFVNVYNIDPTSSDAPEIENRAQGSGMAYIFYTSGTTGVPKGVALTHTNLVHHIDGVIHFASLRRCTMLQQAPLGFDMSLTQMSLVAMLGGTLVVASSETRKDPMQIAQLMLAEKVTHTFMTPTLALAVIHHGYEYLIKCVDWEFALLSGEAVRAHVIPEFKRLGLKNLSLVDGYGPTEITINSSCGLNELSDNTPRDTRNPSIGLTLPNYSCYILDENMQPVRPGFAGELVVGGCGIALGYLNREDLTQARFLPDPFASPEDISRGWTRMYRTGDKARFLPDGRITFLGRIAGDSQIKLRGFRIELEDVANTIVKASKGAIPEAAVSLRQDESGDGDSAFLVAFAIISATHCPSDIRAYLKQLLKELSLPQYMIPARIVPTDKLPMNSSGKLDQYALDALPVPLDDDAIAEPLSETQEKLKLGWLKALPPVASDATIGPDTDFFAAGGNSLRIVTLREYISREFGVAVSVFDLFQANTLNEMAAKIDGSAEIKNTKPIDWVEETRIDSNVSVMESPASQKSDKLEIALTGSTGFLGLSILKSLLANKAVARVHCLAIRSSAKLDPVFSSPRVACYQGDLSLPRLGLSEEQFDTLAQSIDRIIHNGADVSFLKTYQSLRRPNVEATRELARMAVGRGIPFHFVSTGGVVNLTGQDGLAEVSVSDFKPPVDGSHGYVASKWASEHILESHSKQGLPVWIHRPANITGTNAPTHDLMQNILRYSAETGCLPELSGWKGYFDFVPVENVAEGIVISVTETGEDKLVYRHHCGTKKTSVDDLKDYLETEQGKVVDTVSVEEWLDRAKTAGLDPLLGTLVHKTLGQGKGIVPWLRTGSS